MSLDLTTQPTTGRPTPALDQLDTPTALRPTARPSQAHRAAAAQAIDRDLARLTRVLGDPITKVRRTALVGHVGYLVDQLQSADPSLADRHAGTLSRLLREARRWSREPARRPDLFAATGHAACVLAPLLSAVGRSAHAVSSLVPAPPDGDGAMPGPGGSVLLRLSGLPAQGPIALAYRYFWLLDDLPSYLAEPLTREFTAPVRWVLRNVLSGGYNRRAYLMWVGGGSGPAV